MTAARATDIRLAPFGRIVAGCGLTAALGATLAVQLGVSAWLLLGDYWTNIWALPVTLTAFQAGCSAAAFVGVLWLLAAPPILFALIAVNASAIVTSFGVMTPDRAVIARRAGRDAALRAWWAIGVLTLISAPFIAWTVSIIWLAPWPLPVRLAHVPLALLLIHIVLSPCTLLAHEPQAVWRALNSGLWANWWPVSAAVAGLVVMSGGLVEWLLKLHPYQSICVSEATALALLLLPFLAVPVAGVLARVAEPVLWQRAIRARVHLPALLARGFAVAVPTGVPDAGQSAASATAVAARDLPPTPRRPVRAIVPVWIGLMLVLSLAAGAFWWGLVHGPVPVDDTFFAQLRDTHMPLDREHPTWGRYENLIAHYTAAGRTTDGYRDTLMMMPVDDDRAWLNEEQPWFIEPFRASDQLQQEWAAIRQLAPDCDPRAETPAALLAMIYGRLQAAAHDEHDDNGDALADAVADVLHLLGCVSRGTLEQLDSQWGGDQVWHRCTDWLTDAVAGWLERSHDTVTDEQLRRLDAALASAKPIFGAPAAAARRSMVRTWEQWHAGSQWHRYWIDTGRPARQPDWTRVLRSMQRREPVLNAPGTWPPPLSKLQEVRLRSSEEAVLFWFNWRMDAPQALLARLHMLRVALRVEAVRLATGQWPATLTTPLPLPDSGWQPLTLQVPLAGASYGYLAWPPAGSPPITATRLRFDPDTVAHLDLLATPVSINWNSTPPADALNDLGRLVNWSGTFMHPVDAGVTLQPGQPVPLWAALDAWCNQIDHRMWIYHNSWPLPPGVPVHIQSASNPPPAGFRRLVPIDARGFCLEDGRQQHVWIIPDPARE